MRVQTLVWLVDGNRSLLLGSTEVRTALTVSVKKAAIEDFRKEFLAKLRTIAIVFPLKSRGKEANEGAPHSEMLALRLIKARLKDFSVVSARFYFPFQIKDLHELRILAKRLRYAIELVDVCWATN